MECVDFPADQLGRNSPWLLTSDLPPIMIAEFIANFLDWDK